MSKYSYGYSQYSFPLSPPLFSRPHSRRLEPERGDVVVFRLPRDDSTDYIKRVIGLPGDHIQMIDGLLYINGQPVKRERMPDWIDEDHRRRVKRWRETLPDTAARRHDRQGYRTSRSICRTRHARQHAGLHRPGRSLLHDGRQPRQLDRQPRSRRQVGYVPFENIVGKAQIIFFSVGEGEAAWEFWSWPWSVRWNRLFTTRAMSRKMAGKRASCSNRHRDTTLPMRPCLIAR